MNDCLFCKIAATVHDTAWRIDVKHNSKHIVIFHAVIECGLDSVVIVTHQSPPALGNGTVAKRTVNVNHRNSVIVQGDIVAIIQFAIFFSCSQPTIFIF